MSHRRARRSTAGDLLRWTGRVLSGRRQIDALRETVRGTFGVAHCFPVSTGRAALTLLLQALSRLSPDRREVIVPAYTCFSVPASIVKAGLTPRIVDVRPDTLDFSADALAGVDGRSVLAVIATNLYGMPNDLPALSQAARQMGAFLIDDAAQAMGADVGGRASGTWGDAGLYSLDKGKNISAIDGGLLVTRSDGRRPRDRARLARPRPAGRRRGGQGRGQGRGLRGDAAAVRLLDSAVDPAARARPHRVHDRVPARRDAVDAGVAGADHAAAAPRLQRAARRACAPADRRSRRRGRYPRRGDDAGRQRGLPAAAGAGRRPGACRRRSSPRSTGPASARPARTRRRSPTCPRCGRGSPTPTPTSPAPGTSRHASSRCRHTRTCRPPTCSASSTSCATSSAAGPRARSTRAAG